MNMPMTKNSRRAYLLGDSDELDPVQDGSSALSDDSTSDAKLTAVDELMTLADDAVVTFKRIGEVLGEKSNTISARWFPQKIAPAYEGRQCPPLYTSQGGKLKPTGFGAKAIIRYVQQCVRSDRAWESWRDEIHAIYPAIAPEPINSVVEAELLPDELMSSGQIAAYRQQRSEQQSEDLESAIATLVLLVREVKATEEEAEKAEEERLESEALKKALEKKRKELEAKKRESEAEAKADKLVQKILDSLE